MGDGEHAAKRPPMRLTGTLTPARASLLAAGLMCTLPFLQPYHRFPLTSFYSEWLAFALGLAAASLLLRGAALREAPPVLPLALLGLAALLLAQAGLGRVPYPEQSWTAALYLGWAALMVLLGNALRRELGMPVVVPALAWFVLGGGLVNAAAGLLQHYEIATPLAGLVARKNAAAVFGNLAQANHYAAQLALALASGAYLYACGRLRGGPAAACAALLLASLALSGSRSAWLYLGSIAALAAVAHRLQRDAASRRVAAAALALLPLFGIAHWVMSLPFLIPGHGMQVTAAQRLFETAGGVEARVELAAGAWGMFRSAPWFGAGWGQFAWQHFLNQAAGGPGMTPGVFHHAHNVVLQLLAETGLAGALLVIGAALAWLADLRRTSPDPEWWWLLALLAVIGAHSMLEYPLWYAYFLGPAALLLGIGARRTVRVRLAAALRAALAFALVLGWVHALAVLKPYRDFERLVFAPGEAAALRLDEAAFVRAFARVHRDPLLAPYAELALAYGVALSRERLREKLDLVTRAMRFAPVPVVAYRQAMLLALAGERAAALAQLERAARAYPAALGETVAQLRELEQRHPGSFAPLLEWAATESAELRARGAGR